MGIIDMEGGVADELVEQSPSRHINIKMYICSVLFWPGGDRVSSALPREKKMSELLEYYACEGGTVVCVREVLVLCELAGYCCVCGVLLCVCGGVDVLVTGVLLCVCGWRCCVCGGGYCCVCGLG